MNLIQSNKNKNLSNEINLSYAGVQFCFHIGHSIRLTGTEGSETMDLETWYVIRDSLPKQYETIGLLNGTENVQKKGPSGNSRLTLLAFVTAL